MAEGLSSGSADGRILLIANGFFPIPVPLGHIAAVYRQAGFIPHIIPFELRNTMNVRVYARTIRNHVCYAQRLSGRRVCLVGLSMGGVAGLYAIKYLELGPQIHTLLAIGSPFRGSPLAGRGLLWPVFSRTDRQLSPNSDLLRELRRATLPPGSQFISLGGKKDRICPPPTTFLPEATNYLWRFRHHDLLFFTWLHKKAVKLLL